MEASAGSRARPRAPALAQSPSITPAARLAASKACLDREEYGAVGPRSAPRASSPRSARFHHRSGPPASLAWHCEPGSARLLGGRVADVAAPASDGRSRPDAIDEAAAYADAGNGCARVTRPAHRRWLRLLTSPDRHRGLSPASRCDCHGRRLGKRRGVVADALRRLRNAAWRPACRYVGSHPMAGRDLLVPCSRLCLADRPWVDRGDVPLLATARART